MRRLMFIAVISLAAAGCGGSSSTPDGDTPDGDQVADGDAFEDPGVRLRSDGWLRGDLHLHTKWSDGMDSTAMVIAIAGYLEDTTFLAAHPEYAGNGLDFISITDHRTAASLTDPGWTSDRLILVPGEEFGSDGHANLFGIDGFVDHDPGGDGTTLDDLLNAIDTIDAIGGVFSINHPMAPGDPWPWDTRTHHALEIWNTRWAMQAAPFPADTFAEWERGHGPASPLFTRAIRDPADQTLRLYEAMLARGLHVAAVGGSDRHVMFMIGYPTTWIRPAGPGAAGVAGGIRARHTFVSRSPVAATIEMAVETGSTAAVMGDMVAIPSGGTEVSITLRAGRAEGGRLRLIRGSAVATDEGLATAGLGEVADEAAIGSPDFVHTVPSLRVAPGDWLYPVVLEPLHAPGLTGEQKTAVDEIAAAAVAIGSENYAAFASLFLDYLDIELIVDPAACDPADWRPDKLQCVPLIVGGQPTSTFFVPDWIDRGLNAVPGGEGPAVWCMGAVGSAVRFVE